MENLPDYFKDFTLFGFLVGWRKGEIAALAWADVDGDCFRLRAENSKNGEGRVVVLEGELNELIERRKAARVVKECLLPGGYRHAGLPSVCGCSRWGVQVREVL